MDPFLAAHSFIQLSSALAKGIEKTREVADQIRDAPKQVQDRLNYLRNFRAILLNVKGQLEQDGGENGSPSSIIALDAVLACKRMLEDLVEAVIEFKLELENQNPIKRKIFYARLKSKVDKIVALERQLSEHNQLLQLSLFSRQREEFQSLRMQQFITQATAQAILSHQNSIPTSKPTPSQLTILNQSNTGTESLATYSMTRPQAYGVKVARRRNAVKLTAKLPGWLLSSAYDICLSRSYSGISFQIRAWNTIDHRSEILRLVESGNVGAVLALFRQGKASPFDRDPDGRTLLHWAAHSRQPEMCQMLISNGLGATVDEIDDRYGENSLVPLLQYQEPHYYAGVTKEEGPKKSQVVEIFRKQLQWLDDIPFKRLFDLFEWDHGRLVEDFQRMFMPSYSDLPRAERLEAVRLGSFVFSNDNLLMRLFKGYSCSEPSVTEADMRGSTDEKLSLLHSGAIDFGCRYAETLIPESYSAYRDKYREIPNNLVVRAASVSIATDLHAIETIVPWEHWRVNVWTGTPLSSAIGGAVSYINGTQSLSEFYVYSDQTRCCPAHMDTVLQGTLNYWLAMLQKAGVDLTAYGEREVEVLRQDHSDLKGSFDANAIRRSRQVPRPLLREYRRPRNGDYYWIPIRIIGMEYGSQLCDWKLLWAPEYETFGSDFWKLVDEIELDIPGSWVEL